MGSKPMKSRPAGIKISHGRFSTSATSEAMTKRHRFPTGTLAMIRSQVRSSQRLNSSTPRALKFSAVIPVLWSCCSNIALYRCESSHIARQSVGDRPWLMTTVSPSTSTLKRTERSCGVPVWLIESVIIVSWLFIPGFKQRRVYFISGLNSTYRFYLRCPQGARD